jgi:hypothetical protein
MKILYIPLDERPCNLYYPQLIARLQPQLQLLTPCIEQLGQKKKPAEIDRLWDWFEQHSPSCQIAILSIEMMVYGGLLPSRLHHHPVDTLLKTLQRLHALKTRHPGLEIFASTLIMRSPAYDSSEEEPDYYATFGARIFKWGWLHDKANRLGLTTTEAEEWSHLQQAIPIAHLEDYRQRRARNLALNQAVIELVAQGIISFLVIPQDDSAPYGFTALDQQQVVPRINELRLQQRIHLYPGADEVGCTLLARAYSQLQGVRPQVSLLFSAVGGEHLIPLYEDRPLGESLKSHVLAAGAQLALSSQTADVILAVNTAGQVMQEAWDQPTKDLTYTTHRNLRFFGAQLQHWLEAGKAVAIADVAFANGGETELIKLLDDMALWDKILAYAGWNTCCNTIGTVLATAILALDAHDQLAVTFNKIYHLLEGWAYQAIVRMEMVQTYLPEIGASYYNFNGQTPLINQEMARRMRAAWAEVMRQSFREWDLEQLEVWSPWQRMFEIGLTFKIKPTADDNPSGPL